MDSKATGKLDHRLLEVAVESVEQALKAQSLGAHRIELCSALASGGLTPSHGTIRQTVDVITLPIHVMIRPRAGGFTYGPQEIKVMLDVI